MSTEKPKFNTEDIRYGLVKRQTTAPLFNVIPMKDFVKLNGKEKYELEKDYQVRFKERSSQKMMMLYEAQLKFIGNINL